MIVVFVGAAALAAAAAGFLVVRAFAQAEPQAPPRRRAIALAATGVLGAGALLVYLLTGSPGYQDQPYAARLKAIAAKSPETVTPAEIAALAEQMARKRPDEPGPRAIAGQAYMEMGDFESAVAAFEKALARKPDDPRLMIALASALFQRDGALDARSRALFQAAAAADPTAPEPFFYQALDARLAGDPERARPLWAQTLRRLAEDDPRRAMVSQMLAEKPVKPAP